MAKIQKLELLAFSYGHCDALIFLHKTVFLPPGRDSPVLP